MAQEVTYSYARQNLATLLQDAEDHQQAIIIKRRGHEDMALVPAAELRSVEETAHLTRSPKNARRLLRSLLWALEGEGEPQSVESLRAELDLRE